MTNNDRIKEWVEQTPLVDTHEHLIEESERLAGKAGTGLFPCNDWAYIFMHYLGDDFISAGMPDAAFKRFLALDTSSEEKYRLAAPFWERTKHTGYAQAVRETLRGLYGEDDLTEKSAPRIAEKYLDLIKPGFYRKILKEKSNLESCQVNSLQGIFIQTEQPDLLPQDIGFPPLCTDISRGWVEEKYGKMPETLDGWLEIVDWHFTTYGPLAIAAKNQSAYSRRLDYETVSKDVAEPIYSRFARGESLSPADMKVQQDYLFRYCVGKATEFGLPVKLHTGYYAGHDYMPLSRLRQNAGDLCQLLRDYPETKFILMHIGYPYQDEYIALAKHYRNAYIDMCWAWIINPAAGVRFLKEFLLAAPACKLFPFGGDYITVETVYGHSRIARKGITQALTELVDEDWLAIEETQALVERLLNGNAHEVFPGRE